MPQRRNFRAISLLALLLAVEPARLSCFSMESPTEAGVFFEKRIRPLLVEYCYKCHSAEAEKLKGGLRLDSRDGLLKGGDSGTVVAPGEPEKSLLIKAVSYQDADLQMPPKKRLNDRQIADLTEWVRRGASWPAGTNGQIQQTQRATFEITAKDRAYWAFQPVRRPAVPRVNHKEQVANPIDAFILADLDAKGLAQNPPASRRGLIRRIYFDLIGLPPSPEAVAVFEKDRSPDAYEKLIDQLLSMPQYGERWGRYWLDVARFAQSNGYERDGEKPFAWRYRDYVINAFNEDKPYDRFVIEQLAGDELEPPTRESIVATGFQRLGVWDDEPDDKRMAEFDELDDILSTTSAAFLGLTMGCARCHDHKFDPIPQSDYYQLLAFFRNVSLNENPKFNLDSSNYVPLSDAEQVKQWHGRQQAKIKSLQGRLDATGDGGEKKKLQQQIDATKNEAGPFEWALAIKERGPVPPSTHVLVRGNPASPGAEVRPAFLTVLGGRIPSFSSVEEPDGPPPARRLALARWIASAENPLTARVMANRIWQHHFGKGLVKTTTDFGRAGSPPTNPKLLDWLAAEFVQSGWSVKRLHKMILLSNTYRIASRAENGQAARADPGNDLLWRQNLRRLDAEAIRDTILAISGELNLRMGGRGFFPHLGGEVLAGQSRPGLDWEISAASEQSRRSVYTYIRRTMLVPMLDAFDYSNTTSPLGERPNTTVAPQALMLVNDTFMRRQAAAFASRLLNDGGADAQKEVQRAYRLACGRDPSSREMRLAMSYLKRPAEAFTSILSRLTFRPDVPNSISVEYLGRLRPEDFMIGPRDGWSYYRGRWPGLYEGIRTVDRAGGPFALWGGVQCSDAVIEAKLTLQSAAESGSLLFRARAEGEEQRGYELALDPRRQRLLVRRHAAELSTLAEAEAPVLAARPVQVKIDCAGPRIRVWLDASKEPMIDVTDPTPLTGSGQIGVRAWGAALSVEALTVRVGDRTVVAGGESNGSAARHALESFCLLLLNLNEVFYVD